MQILEHELEDGRFKYVQVERRGDVALYTQTHKASGTVRYEVMNKAPCGRTLRMSALSSGASPLHG